MKKLKLTLVTVLLVLSIGVPVFASNSSDTSYSFSCPELNIVLWFTNGRSKQDSSSTYVKFNSTSSYGLNAYGVLFSVWGDNSSTLSNSKVNCTLGVSSCKIYPNSKRLIRQYVKEWGYSYAFLAASGPNHIAAGETATGVWSPDSTGTYTYAN